MTTMLSLILAFMLSIGGSPADVFNTSRCLEASYIQALVAYGNGIDERIEIEKHVKNQDGNYEWKSYLPIQDSIGNVTALTNDKGHLIERYNYSPYGEVTYFNTESSPGIDYVRIKDGVIRIKFDRPVDPGKIYIYLYIKSTQQVISGNKEYINIEEIGYRTSTLPTDEMLTLNLKNQSGTGEPIDIFSQDFTYQGQADVILHDGGKPYVKKEVQVENNIVIIFNEEIDSNEEIYEVELEKNNIKIDGTLVRTGANEYKFFPSGGLVKDAAYKLRMSGFKDLLGNAMDDLEHSFMSTENNTLIFEHSILTANNHSIIGNTSLMHGRDYEPEVGLYYFRNRYYHPQLGRFLQQDPMGYEDSQNLYQAFNQNPVNFTDPFGLFDQLHMKYYNDENYMKRLWHDNPPTWKDIDTMLTNLSRWTQHSVEGGINTVLNAAQGLLHTFNSALIYGYGDRDFVYYNFDFKEGFVKRLDTRSAGRKFLGMAGGDLIEGVGTTLKAGYKLLDHNISEDERMEYERTFFNGVGADITIGRGLYLWRKSFTSTETITSPVSYTTNKRTSLFTNQQLVQEIANRSEMKVGGTGRIAGIYKHSYTRRLLDRYQRLFGDRGLRTETSWLNNLEVPYGTKGSIRLDVYDVNTGTVFDFKFTQSPPSLFQTQINKIMNQGPLNITSIIEVNK
jgi:RHS repeat-associated protein